jgi:hypothetical protein
MHPVRCSKINLEFIPMKASSFTTGLLQGGKQALLSVALVAGLGMVAPKPAQALTVVLDFVSVATTDQFGVGTLPETFSTWGFTGLNLAGVRAAVLDAVNNDYLNYPTFGANPQSPLPDGKQLNINFVTSVGQTLPGNGDSEWYYMAIGDANPNVGFLGQACLGCVRNSSGVSTVANGTIFGSTLTDTIASLLSLATSDAQRINLLAGTVAHEIGHSLTLAQSRCVNFLAHGHWCIAHLDAQCRTCERPLFCVHRVQQPDSKRGSAQCQPCARNRHHADVDHGLGDVGFAFAEDAQSGVSETASAICFCRRR